MLRTSLARAARPMRTAQPVRHLNLHEYQSAAIMASKGVNVPVGYPARTPEEAVAAAKKIGDEQVVIKAQILAGGRGLGTFTNGFKGGVHIIKSSQVDEYARKMLGGTLVTKQSGPAGKPVNTIMIAKKMDFVREMYFSILLNRPDPRALVIACAVGGTSIEDLAHSNPEAIVKLPVDMAKGMSDAEALTIVDGLKCKGDKQAAAAQIKALFKMFCECDCTMVEVNPLAEDAHGKLIAADAKVGFDDNAAFRQPDIFKQRDWTQEDPKEVQAAEFDLNYIALDGNIGCMVNGAGLAMATMDIIQLHGGKPANFLDVGGAAGEDQVKGAFKIITQDPSVKCLLVNIFGGIMKCDVIADGIVKATKEIGLKIPLVVRLEGTNVAEGKKIIESSGLRITMANDLDDAAIKAVAAIQA